MSSEGSRKLTPRLQPGEGALRIDGKEATKEPHTALRIGLVASSFSSIF